MAVVLGADVPVQPRGTRQEIEERPEEGKIQIGDEIDLPQLGGFNAGTIDEMVGNLDDDRKF